MAVGEKVVPEAQPFTLVEDFGEDAPKQAPGIRGRRDLEAHEMAHELGVVRVDNLLYRVEDGDGRVGESRQPGPSPVEEYRHDSLKGCEVVDLEERDERVRKGRHELGLPEDRAPVREGAQHGL